MAEEQITEVSEKPTIDAQPDTVAVKVEPVEQKTEYKPTDYEYKSWSSGVPVPDGWERCPGYAELIRRLKMPSPNLVLPMPLIGHP